MVANTQELALGSGGAPSPIITAFSSTSVHDQIELGLTRENLSHFAREINMPFEFEIVGIDAISMNSTSWSFLFHSSNTEATTNNFPSSSYFNHQVPLVSVLCFIKQLSPKSSVSKDHVCDWTDLPFPHHLTTPSCLTRLDAANVNVDTLQKIEKFWIQPGIEKVVMSGYCCPKKMEHWRTGLP